MHREYDVKRINVKMTLAAITRGVVPVRLMDKPIGPEAISMIPYAGTYLPIGWERVNLREIGDAGKHGVCMGDNQGYGAYLVDRTGLGKTYEPALTLDELIERIRPEFGYAIVELGQYQAKIGVFKRLSTEGGTVCRSRPKAKCRWN